MIIVPLANRPIDRSWWKPLGMRASGSHIVSFDGMEIDDDWLLGGVNQYTKKPQWFSAGALRFAAVHVGGMHAVLDVTVTHLRSANRLSDPHQRHRLGQMAIAVETGYAWLDRAAGLWGEIGSSRGIGIVTTADAARLAIEEAALCVLESAERGVGAAGMIHSIHWSASFGIRALTCVSQSNRALATMGHTQCPMAVGRRDSLPAKEPREMDKRLQLLAANRILVVAPHPDDELLGCGGLIAKLAAAGRLFHTLFVTDGGASHSASFKWPRHRLAAQREWEAADALHFLGIGGHARTFLRLRDGDMPSAKSTEWRAAVAATAEVVRAFRPDLALLPWRRDPHCDHRASWPLAQAAIRPTKAVPLCLEYAIWLEELGAARDYPRPGEAEQVAIDVSSELICKRAAIAAHRTQTTSLIDDDPNGFRLMPETIDRLTAQSKATIGSNEIDQSRRVRAKVSEEHRSLELHRVAIRTL